MNAPRRTRAVLVDLDGTLVDTAPDMAAALNLLLAEAKREQVDLDTIRPNVSNGARALVRLGFGDKLEPKEEESLIERFLKIYAENLCRQSRLMPGFGEVLVSLGERELPWGIVTNKPGWLTSPLLRALGLSARAACIVAGDTVERRKPDPMPLLHAAEMLDLAAGDCLYVGDSERDVVAGRDAGMITIVALFGYILADDDPADWRADGMIREPAELLDWV